VSRSLSLATAPSNDKLKSIHFKSHKCGFFCVRRKLQFKI